MRKIFGRQKKQPVAPQRAAPPGAMVVAQDAHSAEQLDMADGHRDGTYFGAPIYQKAPPSASLPLGSRHPYYEPHAVPVHQYPAPPPTYGLQRSEPSPVYGGYRVVERPQLPGPRYDSGSYARSYDAGPAASYHPGLDEPIDPRNYNGTVTSVSYVVHEPGWIPDGPGGGCTTYCGEMPRPGCTTYCGEPPRLGGGCTTYCGEPPRHPYPQPPGPPTTVLMVPRSYPPRRNKPRSVASSSSSSDAPVRPSPKPHKHTADPNLRPFFGAAIKWLDEIVNGRVVGKDNVAVVQQVTPGSPADKAGIKKDDQLEYWNGQKINSINMWKSKNEALRIGETVTIDVHRNGADLKGFKVNIEGTNQKLGNKRVVQSATAAETHNYGY